MQSLSLDTYNSLLEHSTVMERDRYGVKVLETVDGKVVKLFRRKRLLSSALFKPYASRFVANAKNLKRLGFHTVDVVKVAYCKPIKRTLVFYQPVAGQTLRTALQTKGQADDILEKFTVLFAQLHDKGVLFRSFHLNNVIFNGQFCPLGLIDIADMKIKPRPLTPRTRIRNLRHLARYRVDQDSIRSFGVDRFMDIYFKTSHLAEKYRPEFQAELQALLSVAGRP